MTTNSPPARGGAPLGRLLVNGLCLAALTPLAPAMPAHAAPLADPTRPAASALAPAAPAPARTGASAAASAPTTAAAVTPALRVQSVQVPREGRPSALVDGRLVMVGDRLGDREVVAIDTRGVQLRGPQGALRHLPLLDALPAGTPRGLPAPETRLAQGQPR